MGETGKTVCTVVGVIAALKVLELAAGPGVAFTVALSALCLCVGILWGAGDQKSRSVSPTAETGMSEASEPNQ